MSKVFVPVFIGLGEYTILGVYKTEAKADKRIWENITKWDTSKGAFYGKNYNYYRTETHELK